MCFIPGNSKWIRLHINNAFIYPLHTHYTGTTGHHSRFEVCVFIEIKIVRKREKALQIDDSGDFNLCFLPSFDWSKFSGELDQSSISKAYKTRYS